MLLEINFTAVLFSISFLLFMYLLNFTLLKPVGKVIEERKLLIENGFKTAEESSNKADEVINEYNSKIKTARQGAIKLIEASIEKAQSRKKAELDNLKNELQKEKENALGKINKEKESSLAELEQKIKALTDLITNKILGETNLVGTK